MAGDFRAYDVTPDVTRFLMIKQGGDIVVQHWDEELKAKVP